VRPESIEQKSRLRSGIERARQSWRQNVLLHSFGLSITIGTFVFDLIMPLGVAAAVPYALLVLLSLRSPSLGLTWFAATSATILTLLGFALSPPGGEMWKVVLNRLLALFVIWMTAYLCLGQKRKGAGIEQERLKLIQSDKMASLGEVAAGIAHELGNPLAAIQGHVELLETRLGSDQIDSQEIRKVTEIIGRLNERMIRIIRGMRSFARDASSDPLQNAPISHLIRDVLEFSRERLQDLEVDIRLGPMDEELLVPCRESQISQVLVNLITNSIDAVKDLPEKWIQIDLLEKEDVVEISVTDSGNGIPREIQDKVMAPFFTTKDVGKGTGLGLSVSRSLVESHSGSLWIDEQSSNTRFTVSLPKRQRLTS
jgi:signal transduction histidine kinase